jgi:hypothetical protein
MKFRFSLGQSGITDFFAIVCKDDAGTFKTKIVGGSYEVFNIANLDNYDYAGTEIAGSGIYEVDVLTGESAGFYTIVLLRGTPSSQVITHYLSSQRIVNWNGTTEVFGVDNAGKVILASTGLDSVLFTEPSGDPSTWTTFKQWMCWFIQRFRKSEKVSSTGKIKVKNAAGTVITEQAYTETSTDETLGDVAAPQA